LISLPTQAFLQTDKTLIAYHKVINEFNIEMLSRRDQLLRNGNVFNIYMENIDTSPEAEYAPSYKKYWR